MIYTTMQVIEKIRKLANDPLGIIMICDWELENGYVVRWNGLVCVKRKGEKYFDLGETPSDFLAMVDDVQNTTASSP